MVKDELGGKIMTKLVVLRANTYSYLIDDSSKDKKTKRHNKVCSKKKLKFDKFEEINKIVLTSNYDKRMQSIDSIETCIWNERKSSKS